MPSFARSAVSRVHDPNDPNNPGQRLRFYIDQDDDGFTAGDLLLTSFVVDDDWPLTRDSGKGSELLRRETRDRLLDTLAPRAAVLEGSLPLPGLSQRLEFLVVDQLKRSASLC